jgi:hypothetical protein
MRKLLSASVAAVSAVGWLGTADAQTTATTMTLAPVPTQGQTPYASAAAPPASSFTPNNVTGVMARGATANPVPGSVVVHIDGRVLIDYWSSWTSVDKGTAAGLNAGYKVSPNNLATYARLYTGVDGMMANGLRYGGSIEIRENFTTVGQANGSTSTPGFGPLATSASSGASGFSCNQTMYVRRAFGYIASENWGIVRFGEGDGPISLFDNGITTFQFSPTSNLSGGDLQGDQLSAVSIPFLPATVAGNEFTNEKIVYISPQFANFDFAFSWSPYNYNSYAVCSGNAPGPNCVATSAAPLTTFGAKTLNQTQAAVRYQGKFGDLGVLGYGAWVHAGTASYTGPFIANPTSFAAAAPLGSGATGRFDDMNMGQVGVALNYAGFTIGGNWTGGAVNGQLAPRPSGGSMANGWVAGILYSTGPYKIGISAEVFDTQGAAQLAGLTQRREWAIDPAVTYAVAPGMLAFAEYIYQQRSQNGFNFVTSAAGSLAYNNVKGQGFLLGTAIYW